MTSNHMTSNHMTSHLMSDIVLHQSFVLSRPLRCLVVPLPLLPVLVILLCVWDDSLGASLYL